MDIKKTTKQGLAHFSFPEEYGKGGVDDPITRFIKVEELGLGCAATGTG